MGFRVRPSTNTAFVPSAWLNHSHGRRTNTNQAMTGIIDDRVTAEIDGDFVVFRIGMRVNTLWKVHKWLPVIRAMPTMLNELEADPESGLLAYDTKLGIRNHEVVQYWRSFEALRGYALDSNARHAPAIQWTNELMHESDDVGIWHETYLVRAGEYETVYHNAPQMGLGKAGTIYPATGRRRTAAGRLGWTDGDDISYEGNNLKDEPVEP